MDNTFIYNLSETEYLVFKSQRDCFELFSGYEGSETNSKLATYKGGRWIFNDYNQKKLFWFLFSIYKKDFGKALKQYIRSQQDKPKTYMITCAKRRVDIKITKMKRNMWDWFYGTFYGK
jgi:lipoprotein NlpI